MVNEMTTGDHFCTFGILFNFNSDAKVVAKTYCEVLKLMKKDLDEVLLNHPSLIKYVVVCTCSSSSDSKSSGLLVVGTANSSHFLIFYHDDKP